MHFLCKAELTQPGWFFLFVLIRKTTPASLSADASRHLLIAQPPLLSSGCALPRLRSAAVMQGGE
ncbi:MAG: hypothetical protein DMG15_10810 [Acidobacteria bacterium]|nr:MAG: hypothetical protein DMG16_14715 [Acidobacteriota bacterium]PYS13549.1 MAG: hypothetical protein DMG15_10810 [Acidobacteriota bacterium]